MPRRQPSSPDLIGARELELWIDNTDRLVRQKEYTTTMVTKHACRGQFDLDKAAKAFTHVAEAGARDYAREFGLSSWSQTFSVRTRQAVGRAFAEQYAHLLQDCARDSQWCGDLPVEAVKIIKSPRCKGIFAAATQAITFEGAQRTRRR